MAARAALIAMLSLLAAEAAAGSGCVRPAGGAETGDDESRERQVMVREQLESRGIRDGLVLEAMRSVPRHRFVSKALRPVAYADMPLPIGRGQTISQPYVVAYMAETLQLRGGERVLEVGSGSGYAAAVLSRVAAEVYGIELEPELYERSLATLRELGYANVHLRCGDGFQGWPEKAPFDAIVLSCSAESVPAPLWSQLKEGGRLVYPKGGAGWAQDLMLVTKTPQGPSERALVPVRFVPMRRAD
jgi:protein-L-isoaspartate(D-aspartate) O-methyltransferase